MFEYLKGELRGRHTSYCVVDVGGVGYRVQIPLSTYRKLPESGPVQIWIYSRMSEEDLSLYGFISEQERDLFATMVDNVPSLGPKKAMGILSTMTAKELMECVHRGEIGRLKNTKGIGDKLASRLVLELRGKLPAAAESEAAPAYNEAVLALVSLGFSRKEAEEAVAKASRAAPNAPLEELIRKSLQSL